MNSLKTLALAAALAAVLEMPASAEMAGAAVTGLVVSTDPTKQELTIREEKSQQTRTFKVLNPDVLNTLKNGDKVQVNAADEIPGKAVL